MADIFTTLLQNMQSMGFFSFLLPWLFVFAIVYGLLARANLFGGINTRVSAVLAVIIAFFVTGYAGAPISAFFATLFPGATIILTLILVFVLFWLMLMPEGKKELIGGKWFILLLVILFLIAMWVWLGGSLGGIAITEEVWAIIIFIIVIALVVWFVGGAGKEGAQPGK